MARNKKEKDSIALAKKELLKGDILTPIDISKIGTNGDPCFGKLYDLSTKECRMCGDSELCCIKFTSLLGTTRKALEEKNNFKDLETLIDVEGCKILYNKLKKKGCTKKEIISEIQTKFELSREEVRNLYRKFNQ